MTGWFFDELAHAGREHLDPDYVSSYDRKAGTDFATHVARLRELGLGPDATLVDLGCGTGGMALAAAPHCRRVIAVDVSPAMLEAARRNAGRRKNVECVQAGFLTYEHAGEAPAFVYSRNALHHLPDLWKALALERTSELLASEGIFVLRDFVFSFEPHEAEKALEAWLQRAAASSAEGWTRSELETHLRSEYSTFTWLLEPMIEHAGFEILEADYSDSQIYVEYVLCSRS